MSKLYTEAELVQRLVDALEEIIHPVRFMQERLEEGERLNGMVAVQLAEDAEYLRGIAIATLAAHRKQEGRCMSESDELTALQKLRVEIDQLKITFHEMIKDKARLDWLADVNNNIGNVLLPRDIVERNLGSLRDGIDEAMKL